LPEQYLPAVWEWLQEFARQMVDDLSPKSEQELRERHRLELDGGGKQYFFVDEQGPAGFVWFTNAGDGMYTGHLVFRRDLHPRLKRELAADGIDMLFRDGARKVIWMVFADNKIFANFLGKVGAEREGYLKQIARRRGELVDVVMMASFAKVTA
jgi:RimJ/RimL family protein N-acetyltransferase